MTELTEAIRNYLPSDDREAADKVAFLQFLEAFGETSYDRENLVGHVRPGDGHRLGEQCVPR